MIFRHIRRHRTPLLKEKKANTPRQLQRVRIGWIDEWIDEWIERNWSLSKLAPTSSRIYESSKIISHKKQSLGLYQSSNPFKCRHNLEVGAFTSKGTVSFKQQMLVASLSVPDSVEFACNYESLLIYLRRYNPE